MVDQHGWMLEFRAEQWYQMIGLGRRSVPGGISAKKSKKISEPSDFLPNETQTNP